MRALDTKVLARFFVDDEDDPESTKQRPAAVAALSERAFVPVTVLLELEWVMRGFYRLARVDVIKVFSALAGLQHIVIEDRTAVLAAVDAMGQGVDFADALHVARSARASVFATFDRRLAARGSALGVGPPVALLNG